MYISVVHFSDTSIRSNSAFKLVLKLLVFDVLVVVLTLQLQFIECSLFIIAICIFGVNVLLSNECSPPPIPSRNSCYHVAIVGYELKIICD